MLTWVGVFSKADVQHLLRGGLQHSICVGVLKEAPDHLCWNRSLQGIIKVQPVAELGIWSQAGQKHSVAL